MGLAYELWDLLTGERVGAYGSGAAALAVVWDLVGSRGGGPAMVDGVALVHTAAAGGPRLLAEGAVLARRARTRMASREQPLAPARFSAVVAHERTKRRKKA